MNTFNYNDGPYIDRFFNLGTFVQNGTNLHYQVNDENELIDNRSGRNFDQLISERIDQNFENFHQSSKYNDVFSKIKDTLLLLTESDNIDFSEKYRETINPKYNLDQTTNTINELKRNIVDIHTKKIHYDNLYYTNKQKYEEFSNNIFASITSIDTFKEDPKNDQLKEMLIDRIGCFYNELNLDSLKENLKIISKEFTYMKQYLIELSGISNPITCQICLENQIEYFIDPCGHTLCKNCKDKTSNTRVCHICRAVKGTLKRLYL